MFGAASDTVPQPIDQPTRVSMVYQAWILDTELTNDAESISFGADDEREDLGRLTESALLLRHAVRLSICRD